MRLCIMVLLRITNKLREWLLKKNSIISETDTEVVVHLLNYKGNPLEAIAKMLRRVRSSYALGILFLLAEQIYPGAQGQPTGLSDAQDGVILLPRMCRQYLNTREVCYLGTRTVLKRKAYILIQRVKK